MAKIETPVAHFTGISAGVSFVDGVGETTDEAALAYFTAAGYIVSGEVAEDAHTLDQKPVSKMTIDELKILAQQKGITIPSGAKKPDIQKLLDSKDLADPGSTPIASEGAEVGNTPAGDGPETGAAAGAVFGGQPAASDSNNQDAQGEVVA